MNNDTGTGTAGDAGNVRSWRDLADRLTPLQIAQLEQVERQDVFGPDGLVRIARAEVRSNEAQQRFAHIPAPADAVDAPAPWAEFGQHAHSRIYTIFRRELDYRTPGMASAIVSALVLGEQFSDDRPIERGIYVDGDGLEGLTAARAREVAAAIVEAADVLDAANGADQ